MIKKKKMDEYIARIENINPYLSEDKQLWVYGDEDHIVLGITDWDEVGILAVDDDDNEMHEIDAYLTAMENIIEWRNNKPFKW